MLYTCVPELCDLMRDINNWSEKVGLAVAYLNYKLPASILQIYTQ